MSILMTSSSELSETASWTVFFAAIVIVIVVYAAIQHRSSLDRHGGFLNIKGSYKARPLLTSHEREFCAELKRLTDRYGLMLLIKVRLLDLAEPVHDSPQYITLLRKVQSKHVDFVICDRAFQPRWIVELDDSSHQEHSRIERDHFVDEVLDSCGYHILHIYQFDAQKIRTFLSKSEYSFY